MGNLHFHPYLEVTRQYSPPLPPPAQYQRRATKNTTTEDLNKIQSLLIPYHLCPENNEEPFVLRTWKNLNLNVKRLSTNATTEMTQIMEL